MGTVTFDTFRFVERLEKAGLSREQAAAIAEAQKDAFAEALDATLATKTDVSPLEARLDSLGKDIQTLELRLTVRLGVFISVATGIVIAVLQLPR